MTTLRELEPAKRPCGTKPVMDLVHNRVVTVVRYGIDASGEFVEVRFGGSYGAHDRLPLSCVRTLTPEEKTAFLEESQWMYVKRPRRVRT